MVQSDLLTTWFANFVDGDFHLLATHPFGTMAEWNDGDPGTDIDGMARAGVDGTAEAPGADLP